MGVAQVFHKSFWVQLSPGINPHKNLSRPRHKSNSIQQSSETLGDFFIHSKTAQEHQSVNMAGPTDAELMKICQDAFDEAFEILYSDEDWKEEKKNDKGDLVVSRKTKTGKKIYRVTAVIDIDTKKLANKLADTSDLTNWNKTLVKHELIKKLGDRVQFHRATSFLCSSQHGRETLLFRPEDRWTFQTHQQQRGQSGPKMAPLERW